MESNTTVSVLALYEKQRKQAWRLNGREALNTNASSANKAETAKL
ncbi:hypothetical protein SynBIOSE41_02791 [Synechococcus sp. BIOS-E4-1]|nr:hypothetical protein [Synechococcus sp. BIOS-E4-1]QNI55280.1 hypothetical protein SynBIOSE41_02791 [Synechococcus sp. BIOS-E4-1]